jgi:hypothetical protein
MNRREFLCRVGCAGAAGVAGCATSESGTKKGTDMSPDKTSQKPEAFSYCGIDCDSCDVLKATVHGDRDARTRAAKLFAKTASEHWGMDKLDPMTLDCTGCRAGGVQHKGYGRCPIRPCAQRRGLSSCGLCTEWRQCGRLGGVFADAPQARDNLERIAKGPNP